MTNVAPQWQNSFNGGVWMSLEEDCWKNICADTLYVVGSGFADDDTTVTDQSGDVCVVPTNFYRDAFESRRHGETPLGTPCDQIQCVGWFENRAYPAASLRRI